MTDNKQRTNSQSGLTIVELAIALIVVAVSSLAFYQIFITGALLITEQYQRRVALEKAQAWIEQMQYYRGELGIVPMSFQRAFTDMLLVADGEHEEVTAECRISVEYSSERDRNTNIPYYSEVMVLYEWEALSEREYRIELRSKF